jgi:ATP-dependent DNA helicase RecG
VHLRRLRDLELLAMKGSGSRTYYVPDALFAASR